MGRRNSRVPASFLALSLSVVVLSAGDCPVAPPVSHLPTRTAAGMWNGEALGVRMRFTVTQDAMPDQYSSLVQLDGSGWLIYGTPAESIAVAVFGYNEGEPTPGVSFQFTKGGGPASYGNFAAKWQADGALLGPLSRSPTLEPTPSPWPAVWPAGAAAVSLRLTRQ